MEKEFMPMHQRVDADLEQVGKWRVQEKFSTPKDLTKGLEDGVYLGKNIALVCDGVSSRTKEKIDEKSPGQFAVHAALEALEIANPKKVNSKNIVEFLTLAVRTAIERAKAEGKEFPEKPSFVFAAFFPKENRIVRVKDCSYLIDGKGDNPPFLADAQKPKMFKRLDARIGENNPEREKLQEDLRQALREWQWSKSNKEGPSILNYGVINGELVPANLIEYIPVPRNAKEVVLASDGYPQETLAMSLAETNSNYQKLMRSTPISDFYVDDLTYLKLKKE